MKKTGSKKRGMRVEFDNFFEALDYIKAPNPNSHAETYPERSDFCEWSYGDAVKFMNEGWKEGVDKVEGIASKLNRELDTTDEYTYNIENDVVGDYIDMGLYMAGEPECFGRIDLLPQPKESINVMVSVSYSSMVGQATIYNRGAVLTNLIERLRKRYHVNLQFGFSAKNIPVGEGGTQSKCKKLDVIFNMDTSNEYSRDLIAFYTANSSFLRRIIFKIMERALNCNRCGYSYGSAEETLHDSKVLYFGAIYGGEDERPWKTLNASVKTLEGLLEKYDMS